MFKKNLNAHGRFPFGLRPFLFEHHATRSARAMRRLSTLLYIVGALLRTLHFASNH